MFPLKVSAHPAFTCFWNPQITLTSSFSSATFQVLFVAITGTGVLGMVCVSCAPRMFSQVTNLSWSAAFPSLFPFLAPSSPFDTHLLDAVPLMPIWCLPDACFLFTWSLSHLIVLSLFLRNTFTYSLLLLSLRLLLQILDSLLSFLGFLLVSITYYCFLLSFTTLIVTLHRLGI